MLELQAIDWFTITGRGRVAFVDLRQIADCPERIGSTAELPVKIGERVRIDGDEYEIRGVECSRALISPPFIKPEVGLVVRPLQDLDANLALLRDHLDGRRESLQSLTVTPPEDPSPHHDQSDCPHGHD